MADPNVTVAATFVASVLEHAGYITQARFLEQFQSFFRDAGALIYVISAIGAVVSMAMYGSSRAVQYLLIGPALFWFLVGPTTKSEGVLWKLGGGEYLGMLRQQGQDEALEFRDSVIKKLALDKQDNNGQGNGQQGGADIEVAIGFWLFAKPINEFVNEFVDILLHKESTEDLTAQAKIQGLEAIATLMPYEADHIQHIDGFATQCHEYFGNASYAAEVKARLRGRQAAIRSGANVPGNTTNEALEDFRGRVSNYGLNQSIDPRDPNTPGFIELAKVISEMDPGQGTDAGKLAQVKELAKQIYEQVEGGGKIACADAWKLIATETWLNAKKSAVQVLNQSVGFWKIQEAREYTCEELTRKIYGDQIQGCVVVPPIAMYMLYNHFKNQDTYQSIIARHRNGTDLTNPKAASIVTGPVARNMVPVMMPMADGTLMPFRRSLADKDGNLFVEQLVYEEANPKLGNDDQVRAKWMPLAKINELRGMDYAMNVSAREFDTNRLKQNLVSYAYHLPYYQGVILYLIAVAYPFLALIVLLPGKAQNFLVVPLSWLWAKSWDIGFAVVIILDKIMYNMLPDWNFTENLRNGPWTENEDLIDVIAQGHFFDPWANIHIYYAVLSMATLSIPALTGAAILKAKKGILSSFVDAPAGQAKSRADKAAAGYSGQVQSERNHMMMQVKAMAMNSAYGGKGEGDYGMRGNAAHLHALVNTAFDTANGMKDADKLLSGNPQALYKGLETSLGAGSTYFNYYQSSVSSFAVLASGLSARFDDNIGRDGPLQHLEEAVAGSLDPDGSHELSGMTDTPVADMLKLMASQQDSMILAGGKLSRLTGNAASTLVQNPIAGTVGAIALMSAGKEANDMSLSDLKKATNMEAATDQEFLAVLFGVDRYTYDTRVLREKLDELKAYSDDKDAPFARLMGDVHTALTAPVAPGGPSSLTELYVDAFGSKPFYIKNPNKVEQDELSQSVPKIDADYINTSVQRYQDKALELIGVGANPDGSYTEAQIEAARGVSIFMATMADKENYFNRSLAQSSLIGGVVPDWNQEEVSRLEQDLIKYLNGPEAVASSWNSYFPSNKVTVQEGRGLVFESGESFVGADLLRLVEKKGEDTEYMGERRQRRIEMLGGEGATFESLEVHQKLQVLSIGEETALPKFKFGESSLGISELATKSPLFYKEALQIAKYWASNNESVEMGIGEDLLNYNSELANRPDQFSK